MNPLPYRMCCCINETVKPGYLLMLLVLYFAPTKKKRK